MKRQCNRGEYDNSEDTEKEDDTTIIVTVTAKILQ